ncbi:hypothetical protein SAMN05421882_103015 [Nitrosomonas communis]|uniref:Uncharacterized protein n=1 Tax=Nitrosomonas communis TaxID=44574 RepID=A0A1H2WMR0_9PROT|nr:hypothetical protein SAMN05421882_103015 [Nitrosomonas communis]
MVQGGVYFLKYAEQDRAILRSRSVFRYSISKSNLTLSASTCWIIFILSAARLRIMFDLEMELPKMMRF